MEEARAFRDGIDFHIPKKNLVISARRNEDAEVVVSKHTYRTDNTQPIQTLEAIICILLVAMVLSFILNTVENYQIRVVIILASMWLVTFAYYFYQSKLKKNASLYRYHGAEHKA